MGTTLHLTGFLDKHILGKYDQQSHKFRILMDRLAQHAGELWLEVPPKLHLDQNLPAEIKDVERWPGGYRLKVSMAPPVQFVLQFRCKK